MLWITILAMVSALLIYSRWKKRKMMKLYNQFKPKYVSLPFIGHSYIFLGSGEDRMNSLKKIGEESYGYGGMISHWQGNRLFLLVSDPVPAELILKNCLEKDDLVKYMKTLIGNGSIFAPVKIWRPRRKILAPTFSLKNLHKFVNIFAKQSSMMVDQLKENVGKGTFTLWKYFTTYTMDSVCETTLDIQVNAQKQTELPFLQAFNLIVKMDSQRILQPWLYSDLVFKSLPNYSVHSNSKKIIIDFVRKIITSKKLEMENIKGNNENDQLKTFFELLLESSKKDGGYGETELLEETMVIVLAGTDTSAVGASFVAVMLSRHQEVQERCYEELMEIFGESDRPVTAEDLPRMKYLEAVVKETLRLYPPVPFIVRKVDEDLTLSSEVTLVKGCGIFVSIYAIHRNPSYWGEDADQFRPERFHDSVLKHPAAFMPFSHGPRACLGYQYAMMSMKTALATLLRSYRLLPATGNIGDKHKPIRLKFNVMMKDVDDFEIRLQKRY